jgi:cellobiose-specific phosphotransferase system component IIA
MVDTRIEMIFNAIDAARSNLYRAIQATKATDQENYVRQFIADAKASMDEANKLYREMEIHINMIKDPVEKD